LESNKSILALWKINKYKMKYDVQEAKRLLEQVKSLNSFEEVTIWDGKAEQEVYKINEMFITGIPDELDRLQRKLEQSKEVHSKKTFFARNFTLDTTSLNFKKEMQNIEASKLILQDLRDQLEYWIETTPDDAKEAKAMIAELKLAKKELGTQKKEVRNEIKQVKSQARVMNTKIAGRFVFSSPKLRKWQRHNVRVAKENAVSPLEQMILDMDREMIDIDRMIAWIERIRLD
jgi:hypothetical protein